MKEALELFNNYYSNFDSTLYGVDSKYNHTMRVVEYAKIIAVNLELSDEDIEIVRKCALFHDISRFKQWSKYQTFEDRISFDHGDEGYKILNELGVTDEIVLLSTKYHNKYELPNGIDDRTRLFCDITRDADKIDILIELGNEYKGDDTKVDDEVMECFRNHTLMQNILLERNPKLYSILRYLAFIFDIKFRESFRIIKDKNVVNIKCDNIQYKNKDEQIEEIRNICNKYIEERISD